jgi:hypothetical protein
MTNLIKNRENEMKIGTRLAFAVLLLSGICGAAPGALARTCAEVDEDARVAQADKDLEALIGFYTEAHDPATGCNEQFLADFGRDVALAHIDRFVALYEQDKDAARHKAVLEEARNYGEPWQLMVTLAGVEADLGNHELAASFYQQAVRELELASRSADADSAASENLLSEEEFEMIYGKRILPRLRRARSAGAGAVPVRFGALHQQGRAGGTVPARISP